jgi:hypothetical protein
MTLVDSFVEKVAREYCKCKDCDNALQIMYIVKKQTCGEITSRVSRYSTIEILNDFLKLGLIKKIHEKYYITSNNKKLTWDNIRNINEPSHKKAFWAFRKGIVDSIISRTITPDTKAFSVGSVKISSDYDITISGDTRDIGKILKQFEYEIKDLFSESSGVLFDTNIYGRGFVQYSPGDSMIKTVCNDIVFYYQEYNNSCNESQFIWGLLHCYRSLNAIYGQAAVDLLWDELKTTAQHNKTYLKGVEDLYDYLLNQDLTYLLILSSDDILYNAVYNNKEYLVKKLDSISLSNYYADEAYYTYGAFIDVVVNQQTCKKRVPQLDTDLDSPLLRPSDEHVPLDINTSTQSILDNLGFFILHPTKKYRLRINNSGFYDYKIDISEPDVDLDFKYYVKQTTKARMSGIKILKHIVVNYQIQSTQRVPILELVKSGKRLID